jgi:hypothetical protein
VGTASSRRQLQLDALDAAGGQKRYIVKIHSCQVQRFCDRVAAFAAFRKRAAAVRRQSVGTIWWGGPLKEP